MSTNDKYPPLITSRSPSYERAREERAHPAPTTNPEIVAVLARLFELEEDARQAYLTAAEALQDDAMAQELSTAADHHERRRDALGQRISALGGAAPRPRDCRQLLEHGAASVPRVLGRSAVLKELGALKQEMHEAYEQAGEELQQAGSMLEGDLAPAEGPAGT
jgi:hypothetical protein